MPGNEDISYILKMIFLMDRSTMKKFIQYCGINCSDSDDDPIYSVVGIGYYPSFIRSFEITYERKVLLEWLFNMPTWKFERADLGIGDYIAQRKLVIQYFANYKSK